LMIAGDSLPDVCLVRST